MMLCLIFIWALSKPQSDQMTPDPRFPWVPLVLITQWEMHIYHLPSGKLTVCYGTSPFLMGKSTISMAIFNSYVCLPEGKHGLFRTHPFLTHDEPPLQSGNFPYVHHFGPSIVFLKHGNMWVCMKGVLPKSIGPFQFSLSA